MRNPIFVIVLVFSLILGGCDGQTSTGSSNSKPAGVETALSLGECIDYSIYFDTSRTTLIVCLDGAGPNGAFIRGVDGILQVGDPIIRSVGSELWQIGEVITVDINTAKILIYNKAKIYKSNI